eukprot:2461768-Amphidinium_carterae.1
MWNHAKVNQNLRYNAPSTPGSAHTGKCSLLRASRNVSSISYSWQIRAMRTTWGLSSKAPLS